MHMDSCLIRASIIISYHHFVLVRAAEFTYVQFFCFLNYLNIIKCNNGEIRLVKGNNADKHYFLLFHCL